VRDKRQSRVGSLSLEAMQASRSKGMFCMSSAEADEADDEREEEDERFEEQAIEGVGEVDEFLSGEGGEENVVLTEKSSWFPSRIGAPIIFPEGRCQVSHLGQSRRLLLSLDKRFGISISRPVASKTSGSPSWRTVSMLSNRLLIGCR